MSERVAKRLLVTGRVQGVGYRESMRAAAAALGVSGWVRNLRDGRVEAVVCADPGALDAIVAWAQRGPPAARVERVEVEPASGDFTGFECRSTA
jgi:acylphosphatase